MTKSETHRMLRNVICTGDFMWCGKRHKGSHEPLVTHDTFEQVQAILSGKPRRPPRTPPGSFGSHPAGLFGVRAPLNYRVHRSAGFVWFAQAGTGSARLCSCGCAAGFVWISPPASAGFVEHWVRLLRRIGIVPLGSFGFQISFLRRRSATPGFVRSRLCRAKREARVAGFVRICSAGVSNPPTS